MNKTYNRQLKGEKMGWCDICEREVKGRTHKIGNAYASVYLCDKHYHQLIKERRKFAKELKRKLAHIR